MAKNNGSGASLTVPLGDSERDLEGDFEEVKKMMGGHSSLAFRIQRRSKKVLQIAIGATARSDNTQEYIWEVALLDNERARIVVGGNTVFVSWSEASSKHDTVNFAIRFST